MGIFTKFGQFFRRPASTPVPLLPSSTSETYPVTTPEPTQPITIEYINTPINTPPTAPLAAPIVNPASAVNSPSATPLTATATPAPDSTPPEPSRTAKITPWQINYLFPDALPIYSHDGEQFVVNRPGLAPKGYRFTMIVPSELPLNRYRGFCIPGCDLHATSESLDRAFRIREGYGGYLLMTGRVVRSSAKITISLLPPDDPEADILLWCYWDIIERAPAFNSPWSKFCQLYGATPFPRTIFRKDHRLPGFDLYHIPHTASADSLIEFLTRRHARNSEVPLEPPLPADRVVREFGPLFAGYRELTVDFLSDHAELLVRGEKLWFRYTERDLDTLRRSIRQDQLGAQNSADRLFPDYLYKALRQDLKQLFGPIPH